MNDEAPRYGTPGRLDYDDLEDRLLCHVCGGWYQNLGQHARLAHGLTAAEYRQLCGLNRQTRLITPGLRARLRETTAPTIARLRAQGKLRNWGEDRERLARDKAAAVEALHTQGLAAEGRQRRRDAFTDARRQARAEQRRARNLAGLDRASGAAIAAGLRAALGTGACDRCGASYPRAMARARYCPTCRVIVQREHGRASRRRARVRQQLGETAAPKRADPLARDQSRLAGCPRCGQVFTAASHRDKLCPACRPEAAREYQRQYATRRRRAAGILGR